ncbi:MAG: ABC transporter ATP-binding protein [Saprospiraceae bacterium]|nr:ABC transporter ATP-binding protein [Saprospiraceae bacterium]
MNAEPVLLGKSIRCGYHPSSDVLQLDHIMVYAGELLFVLGRSGIGKSTFLELSGLMNKPTARAEGQLKFKYKDADVENILDLWQQGDQALSQFRSIHYSFIFQETNLLEHYSVGENMCLPALIQGQAQEGVLERALKYMDQVSLNRDYYDRRPSQLSGGQKQRASFIRALLADFSILFGDEPTGNLDSATAYQLMALLKQHINEEKKAAIIVSHDIRLAIQFADRIAVLTGVDETSETGHLDMNNFYERNASNQWSLKGVEIPDDTLFMRISKLIRLAD